MAALYHFFRFCACDNYVQSTLRKEKRFSRNVLSKGLRDKLEEDWWAAVEVVITASVQFALYIRIRLRRIDSCSIDPTRADFVFALPSPPKNPAIEGVR